MPACVEYVKHTSLTYLIPSTQSLSPTSTKAHSPTSLSISPSLHQMIWRQKRAIEEGQTGMSSSLSHQVLNVFIWEARSQGPQTVKDDAALCEFRL